ncbi:MAG: IS200/IS605 family transposase [Saprospiraceae bacterium]|nr:IS200/IS605 family transposase [Saprospiraceae bacterium]
MSTYTQILYQIVFSTKNREHTLSDDKREELFKYMWGILQNNKCHPYQINGVSDHIHILTHLHPSVALANLIKDVKLASSKFIKESKLFPDFGQWQEGYGAFTYSIDSKDRLVNYIKNQERHHMVKTFSEEYIELLQEHDIEFDEKYLL